MNLIFHDMFNGTNRIFHRIHICCFFLPLDPHVVSYLMFMSMKTNAKGHERSNVNTEPIMADTADEANQWKEHDLQSTPRSLHAGWWWWSFAPWSSIKGEQRNTVKQRRTDVQSSLFQVHQNCGHHIKAWTGLYFLLFHPPVFCLFVKGKEASPIIPSRTDPHSRPPPLL